MDRFPSDRSSRRQYGGSRGECADRQYSFEDAEPFKTTRENARKGRSSIHTSYASGRRPIRNSEDEDSTSTHTERAEIGKVDGYHCRNINTSHSIGKRSISRDDVYSPITDSFYESEDEPRHDRHRPTQKSSDTRRKASADDKYYGDDYGRPHASSWTSTFETHYKRSKFPFGTSTPKSRDTERSTRSARQMDHSYSGDEFGELAVQSEGSDSDSYEYGPKPLKQTSTVRDGYPGRSSRAHKGSGPTSTQDHSARKSTRRYSTGSDSDSFEYEPKPLKKTSTVRDGYSERSSRGHKASRPTSTQDRSARKSTRRYSTGSDSDSYEHEPKPLKKTTTVRDGYPGRSSRGHKASRPTSTQDYSSRKSIRRYSTGSESNHSLEVTERSYHLRRDSFGDLSGVADVDTSYDASSKDPYDTSSNDSDTDLDPLSGVDMNIVAMIFIGISVTFNHIRDSRVYTVMEHFFKEYHRELSRNIGRARIEQIYRFMNKEKLGKGYSNMKQERIKEFEEVSFLSKYKRRVKVERRF